MTFAPIKGQCPVCRQDAGLNLDPIVSFSESKQLAELRAENASLKEVISLSEDSRLMDEYLKLERANARQAERIKANEQYEQALKGDCRKQVADLRANIAAQAAVIKRERAARKTAQESLENYKGECTRLQHEVDRLKGEGAQQSERIKELEKEFQQTHEWLCDRNGHLAQQASALELCRVALTGIEELKAKVGSGTASAGLPGCATRGNE